MKIQLGSSALVDPTEKWGRAPGAERPEPFSRLSGARRPGQFRPVEGTRAAATGQTDAARAATGTGQTRVAGAVRTAERNTAATLTIQTADGDTVSLSVESQRRVEQSGVRTAGAAARSSREESSVSVSVTAQGDLDATELKDIEKLVNRFAAGIRDVEQGRSERAAARFERIPAGGPKLDTLAAYAVSIQSEEATQSARFSTLA